MHGVTAGIASVWTHERAGCWQAAIMALTISKRRHGAAVFGCLRGWGNASRASALCPSSS